MFDLIIRNGLVIDGSGRPGQITDVGITGDRITAVEPLEAAQSAQVATREIGLTFAKNRAGLDNVTCLSPLLQPGATARQESPCHACALTKFSGMKRANPKQ
jgi:hypothetical protein